MPRGILTHRSGSNAPLSALKTRRKGRFQPLGGRVAGNRASLARKQKLFVPVPFGSVGCFRDTTKGAAECCATGQSRNRPLSPGASRPGPESMNWVIPAQPRRKKKSPSRLTRHPRMLFEAPQGTLTRRSGSNTPPPALKTTKGGGSVPTAWRQGSRGQGTVLLTRKQKLFVSVPYGSVGCFRDTPKGAAVQPVSHETGPFRPTPRGTAPRA
jgi:hypothetical protein